jgi:hypothetical protein
VQVDFSDRSGSDFKVDYDVKCNKNKHVYKILKTMKPASKLSEFLCRKTKVLTHKIRATRDNRDEWDTYENHILLVTKIVGI